MSCWPQKGTKQKVLKLIPFIAESLIGFKVHFEARFVKNGLPNLDKQAS
jgi:hypothetical protein